MSIDEVKMLIAKDETRTLELKKTTGELHRGMETACAFLNSDGGWLIKHLNLAGRMDSKFRQDTLTVPYTAIKEAAINMLCHRSWNADNLTPSLAIYDDRMVFQNPGSSSRFGLRTCCLHKSLQDCTRLHKMSEI